MAQESWKRDKDETDCKVPEGLILCINNCGLLGSTATMNMCSKCYKDSLLKSSSSSSSPPRFVKSSSPEFSVHLTDSTVDETRTGVSCSRRSEDDSSPPVRHGNRCSSCRKRVGLTGFRCRCGELFCARHRYSDTHDCAFDYKAAGREEIFRANPLVKAAKIIKI